jgi:hypothetical protein
MDMDKIKTILGALLLLLVSAQVSAALISRIGGLAYYDTEADLTWLADANAAPTSIREADGRLYWQQSMDWAAGLSVGGNDNWRLPSSLNSNDTGSCGLGYNCTDSELGNLFYNVLGGTAGTSIMDTHNGDFDLFSNIQFGYYWSSTEDTRYTTDNSEAWEFGMHRGGQATTIKNSGGYAWAVQSGDVNAVPAPPALLLFLTGILGIGFARRRQF